MDALIKAAREVATLSDDEVAKRLDEQMKLPARPGGVVLGVIWEDRPSLNRVQLCQLLSGECQENQLSVLGVLRAVRQVDAEARDIIRMGINTFEPQMEKSPAFLDSLNAFGLVPGFRAFLDRGRAFLGYSAGLPNHALRNQMAALEDEALNLLKPMISKWLDVDLLEDPPDDEADDWTSPEERRAEIEESAVPTVCSKLADTHHLWNDGEYKSYPGWLHAMVEAMFVGETEDCDDDERAGD